MVVLLLCGAIEMAIRVPRGAGNRGVLAPALVGHLAGLTGLAALSWEALKVGALSYGGGFVIIPLMQHDVVSTYHWMSGPQFLNAVALGQLTPGPVVLTTAVVGYAARGLSGALLATVIAFTPSFVFVLAGASRFKRVRDNARAVAFLQGAGPCVVGAIGGSALPLALALHQYWQFTLLAAALVWLLVLRRGVVSAMLATATLGAVAVTIGLAL